MSRAPSRSSAPSALDTRAVAPCEMPALTAMRMKNTGKETDNAAKRIHGQQSRKIGVYYVVHRVEKEANTGWNCQPFDELRDRVVC